MRSASSLVLLAACGTAPAFSGPGDSGDRSAGHTTQPFVVHDCAAPSNATNDASFSPGFTVSLAGERCKRTFALATTNPIRSARVANPRSIQEGASLASQRSSRARHRHRRQLPGLHRSRRVGDRCKQCRNPTLGRRTHRFCEARCTQSKSASRHSPCGSPCALPSPQSRL